MVEAVQIIVSAKAQLERLSRSVSGKVLAKRALNDPKSSGSPCPFTFAFTVLPLLRDSGKENRLVRVIKRCSPSDMVLGHSWNWTPESRTSEQKTAVLSKVLNAFLQSRATVAGHECADYWYIPKLGIAMAHEGKNRVALFRQLGMEIPAVVHDTDYPDADRIRLIALPEGDVAVLDDRYVERVLYSGAD